MQKEIQKRTVSRKITQADLDANPLMVTLGYFVGQEVNYTEDVKPEDNEPIEDVQ